MIQSEKTGGLRLIADPRVQAWIAGLSLVLWTVMFPIALSSGLKSSLVFITIMSLFANVATCFGWWVSALVNVKAERIDDRTEQGAHFARIEESEERIIAALSGLLEEIHIHVTALSPDAGEFDPGEGTP